MPTWSTSRSTSACARVPIRDARFVARTVGKMRLRVVATPALIERTGIPKSLDALPGFRSPR
jgi:hypothetical protein